MSESTITEPEPVAWRHIADEIGISYRQLDYWTRRGWLKPEQARQTSGSWRRWPDEELAVLRRMAALVAVGVTAEAAARLARDLGRHGSVEIAPGLWLEARHA